MSELKPCPFCGGKPNKMHEHNNHALDVIVWCGCESMRDVDYMRVNEWNARAPQSEWISVEDDESNVPSITDEGCSCLVDVIANGERIVDCRYLHGLGIWSDGVIFDIQGVTHYMYPPKLPAPPKSK